MPVQNLHWQWWMKMRIKLFSISSIAWLAGKTKRGCKCATGGRKQEQGYGSRKRAAWRRRRASYPSLLGRLVATEKEATSYGGWDKATSRRFGNCVLKLALPHLYLCPALLLTFLPSTLHLIQSTTLLIPTVFRRCQTLKVYSLEAHRAIVTRREHG